MTAREASIFAPRRGDHRRSRDPVPFLPTMLINLDHQSNWNTGFLNLSMVKGYAFAGPSCQSLLMIWQDLR